MTYNLKGLNKMENEPVSVIKKPDSVFTMIAIKFNKRNLVENVIRITDGCKLKNSELKKFQENLMQTLYDWVTSMIYHSMYQIRVVSYVESILINSDDWNEINKYVTEVCKTYREYSVREFQYWFHYGFLSSPDVSKDYIWIPRSSIIVNTNSELVDIIRLINKALMNKCGNENIVLKLVHSPLMYKINIYYRKTIYVNYCDPICFLSCKNVADLLKFVLDNSVNHTVQTVIDTVTAITKT